MRCTMVAPSCDLTSSPTSGMRRRSNSPAHCASEAMNTGMQFTNDTPASRQARALAAHVVVQEAAVRVGGLLVGGTIEFDALQEAARAVAHPHDADRDLPHTPHSRARPPPARARARLIYSTGGGL